VATSDSPEKGAPSLAPLVDHGREWFANIDETVQKIREALADRDSA